MAKAVQEIVVWVGIVGGVCTAIGFDEIGIVTFAANTILNVLGITQWKAFLSILGPLASITSWLSAYMVGGLLGLIATGLGFVGGFFFVIEPLRLIGVLAIAGAMLLGMAVEGQYQL